MVAVRIAGGWLPAIASVGDLQTGNCGRPRKTTSLASIRAIPFRETVAA